MPAGEDRSAGRALPAAIRLLLVRHGHSLDESGDGNGLTPAGSRQAELVARRLTGTPFDLLLASPYPRCLDTASAIAGATGSGFEVRADLREIQPEPGHIPTAGEMAARYPAARFTGDRPSRPVPAEWRHDAEFRVRRLDYHLRQGAAGATVVVIGHANLFNYLVKSLLHLPIATPVWFRFGHTSITELEIGLFLPATDDGLYNAIESKLIRLNDTSHLLGDGAD